MLVSLVPVSDQLPETTRITFLQRAVQQTMTSGRSMSWILCGDSRLNPQIPLPLRPITTFFGMQLTSMIFTTPRRDLRERHLYPNMRKSMMKMDISLKKNNLSMTLSQKKNLLHIQFINHHFILRCHRNHTFLPTSGKHFLKAPNKWSLSTTRKSSSTNLHHGSKAKPNPTLGKPNPAPQQVHQHSQDDAKEEPPPDTSAQTLVNKCLAESGIDPTDIQNVMSVSHAKRNISSHDSSRKLHTHQRYVFTRVNQSNHHLIDRGANGSWLELI